MLIFGAKLTVLGADVSRLDDQELGQNEQFARG
jgi:hypothetical protein